jgi:hypothetical protein
MGWYEERRDRLIEALRALRAGEPIDGILEEDELAFLETGVVIALPDSDVKRRELANRGFTPEQLDSCARDRQALQEIHFSLIRFALGELGERVASDLKANPDVWIAAMMKRSSSLEWVGLEDLRDMPLGVWNVATLYLYATSPDAEPVLKALAEEWGASTFDFYVDPSAREHGLDLGTSKLGFVAKVWWD